MIPGSAVDATALARLDQGISCGNLNSPVFFKVVSNWTSQILELLKILETDSLVLREKPGGNVKFMPNICPIF